MNGHEFERRRESNNPGLLILAAAFALGAAITVACANSSPAPSVAATPTTDPAIFNQVPETHVFEPGECTAVLEEATPAYTSNTLGGQPSGEIPAGRYEVGVSVTYSTSQWYALNNVGTTNYVNSSDVSSLEGDCNTSN
jgi:hypothetical protein